MIDNGGATGTWTRTFSIFHPYQGFFKVASPQQDPKVQSSGFTALDPALVLIYPTNTVMNYPGILPELGRLKVSAFLYKPSKTIHC